MARFPEFESFVSQKDWTKIGRTFWNWRSTWTCNLSIKTPGNMEYSQCIPCDTLMTIHWNWSTRKQLSMTSTWFIGRRRSLHSRTDIKTSKKRTRISILCFMGRISDHRSIVGIGVSIFCWWWHAGTLQAMTSNSLKLQSKWKWTALIFIGGLSLTCLTIFILTWTLFCWL